MNQPTPEQQLHHHQEEVTPAPQKRSLFSLIKKYYWQIVLFFIIAITSGVLLADHEAKTTTNWETTTSKEAGLTFKHPKAFNIMEDKGWRITVYTDKQNPENNIKIIYSHANPSVTELTSEEQFLTNCQAKRVSEITATDGRIKVYEDSTCGNQLVENSVLVYADNGMTYDIGLFGTIDRAKLYQFFGTFKFEQSSTPLSDIHPTIIPSPPKVNNDAQDARAAAVVAAKYTTDRKSAILPLFDDGSEAVPIYPKGTTIKLDESTWTSVKAAASADAFIMPQNQKVKVYFSKKEGRWWIIQIKKNE